MNTHPTPTAPAEHCTVATLHGIGYDVVVHLVHASGPDADHSYWATMLGMGCHGTHLAERTTQAAALAAAANHVLADCTVEYGTDQGSLEVR